MAQSRGGLVEQQQQRIDAQRARDLDDALLAERQASRQRVGLVAEADALDLPRGFRQQSGLVGTVEPEHARDRTGMPAQMGADRDILQHGHVGYQFDVLEGPGNAELDDFLRRRVVDLGAEHGDRAAARGQDAGNEVEGRALAGAVGTDQGDDLARPDIERDVVDGDDAAELFSRLVDLQQYRRHGCRPRARRQSARRIRYLAARLDRKAAHHPRPHTGRRQLQQYDQQDAEHDGLELALAAEDIWQVALQDFLEDHHDAGPEHRTPDITGAADDGDEQILDAGLRAERRRVGGALEMRIQPAGQAGQHGCIDEHQK